MLLPNLRVTVDNVTPDAVSLKTEQGLSITIPGHLMPRAIKGTEIFLAADVKPLTSADAHAKDVLNELIKEK